MELYDEMIDISWSATCFKNAKVYDKAKYSYKKAAECFEGMKMWVDDIISVSICTYSALSPLDRRSLSRSSITWTPSIDQSNLIIPRAAGGAKSLEEAGNMAKEEKSYIEAAELYKQASNLMRDNGNSDKAAETLIKAAK